LILDEQLPRWDVRERHSIRIAAPPEVALQAAREVTAREVPELIVLMGLRTLPAVLTGRRRPGDGPLLDGFTAMGFAPLGESATEFAYGGVGRFWTPSGGLRRVGAAEFAGFAEPGYAKAGFDFRVAPDGPGASVLSTETRVLATDAAARRRFRLYWLVVRPGSGLIRRGWLRAIRKRAERSGSRRSSPA
jgi:hypothetical protein